MLRAHKYNRPSSTQTINYRPKTPELQDMFRQYGEAYRNKYKLPPHILKTMRAIENCRTSVMGGHVDICNDCGVSRISYNSCRNRHCPKCQSLAKEKWIDGTEGKLAEHWLFPHRFHYS